MSATDLLIDFCWKFAFFVGIIFPCLSLLTGITSLVCYWRFKTHSSAIFIPFIGPLCLSALVVCFAKPLWLIPIVWVTDIGTLAFVWISPRLIADWWNVSGFTRILTLRGSRGVQSAILTLHSTGHYLLTKSWRLTAWPVPDQIELLHQAWDRLIDSGWEPEFVRMRKLSLQVGIAPLQG
jgi:hypothetical protein